MEKHTTKIHWPNGMFSNATPGTNWLSVAKTAGFNIPTACLTGSCGACEIEINGKVIKACISNIPINKSKTLKVELTTDPYW